MKLRKKALIRIEAIDKKIKFFYSYSFYKNDLGKRLHLPSIYFIVFVASAFAILSET